MKHYILLFFIIIFSNSSSYCFAQNTNESEVVTQLCKEKVKQLNDYMSMMASEKKSIEIRKHYKNKALSLFIGKGNSFEENGVVKEGVFVEIFYTSRNRKTTKLVRNFFDQITVRAYTNVRIISAEVAKVYYEETEDGKEPCILLGDVTAEIRE